MKYDRDIYFDSVRSSLFGGKLNDGQVKGQDAIITVWEKYTPDYDPRFLAYMLATAYHETSQEMLPIEEYGKGEGMEYGKVDNETGQTYYGRGFVQTTWRDNYARADNELDLEGAESCEWHAENQLDPVIAARTMFKGMYEGWFRSDDKGRQTLPRYFSETVDDAYLAREIINGDKTKVPSWSNGVSIGNLIKGYHQKFFKALEAAALAVPPIDEEGEEDLEHIPPPVRPTRPTRPSKPKPPAVAAVVIVDITVPDGVTVEVKVNGGTVIK